ncbi:hypothetical protein [Laspinema olomoucense]|uniref:Uncharacterized protein n=1 Tax=Laspinema olomoucense D3b TaxID=2953688 RepID=A0ABT2NJW7_9CYAN|nr:MULTISPECIES: hypothetical protein [unclassified Laspinema]MCT7974094.1 hypothetical protein [Laspinema sp. D3d]MCT7981620.1 hypothetical protein [Laspinema sp. D3b]MCT7987402.1 hypothetical protein [Laspinema sp. D3a]MCT7993493.1 hypothetical protein [Laspinema sp. D3c]
MIFANSCDRWPPTNLSATLSHGRMIPWIASPTDETASRLSFLLGCVFRILFLLGDTPETPTGHHPNQL